MEARRLSPSVGRYTRRIQSFVSRYSTGNMAQPAAGAIIPTHGKGRQPLLLDPNDSATHEGGQDGSLGIKRPMPICGGGFFKIEPFAPMTVFVLFSIVMAVLAGLDRAPRDLNILNRQLGTRPRVSQSELGEFRRDPLSRRRYSVAHHWTARSTCISTGHS